VLFCSLTPKKGTKTVSPQQFNPNRFCDKDDEQDKEEEQEGEPTQPLVGSDVQLEELRPEELPETHPLV
jgi:hypothetical protein